MGRIGRNTQAGSTADPRQLRDFLGEWVLERRIVQADGPRARFHGRASWTPSGADLAYCERGLLEMDGMPPMQAERRYLWRPDLSVEFEDGRLFHHVPARGGGAAHLCAPDLYRVRYRFARWPCFETVWRVTGPRKNYAMVTRFTPLAGDCAG